MNVSKLELQGRVRYASASMVTATWIPALVLIGGVLTTRR